MPVNKISIANLRPCKPGERPPGAGRPKGSSIHEILKRKAQESVGPGDPRTINELMVDKLVEWAKTNPKMLTEYFDRLEGKPMQRMIVETQDTNTYQIQFGGVSITNE